MIATGTKVRLTKQLRDTNGVRVAKATTGVVSSSFLAPNEQRHYCVRRGAVLVLARESELEVINGNSVL